MRRQGFGREEAPGDEGAHSRSPTHQRHDGRASSPTTRQLHRLLPMVDFILNDPPGSVGQLGPWQAVAAGVFAAPWHEGARDAFRHSCWRLMPVKKAIETGPSPDVSGAHITLIGERRVPDLNAMPMLWSVLVRMVPRATDLFLGPRRRCSTLRKRQAPSPLMCRKSSSPTYAARPRAVRHEHSSRYVLGVQDRSRSSSRSTTSQRRS